VPPGRNLQLINSFAVEASGKSRRGTNRSRLGAALSLASSMLPRRWLRQKTDFSSLFKPLGVIEFSNRKFYFRFSEMCDYLLPIPRPQEGRIAIVTDVGCGMRWTRR
jgi:hypothetical protein